MRPEGTIRLTSVLLWPVTLEDVLQPCADTNVTVLGGSHPAQFSELLGSPAMRELLRRLESCFDYIIIEAPPLLPVTDAAVLSTIAGGTIVIVGTGTATREQLAKSLGTIEQVKGRLLGLVLNKVPRKGPDSYAYHRDGYAPESPHQKVWPKGPGRGPRWRNHRAAAPGHRESLTRRSKESPQSSTLGAASCPTGLGD